jgi:hypothetical protein
MFLTIGIIATVIYLLKMSITLLGVDGHHDVSVHHDIGHSDHDFQWLSVDSIAAFFMGFGWTGNLLLGEGFSVLSTTLISVGVANLFMLLSVALASLLTRLKEENVVVLADALCKTGEVYLSIPKDGYGIVRVNVKGSLREYEAISLDNDELSTGTPVIVKAIQGERLVVQSTIWCND